MTMSNGTPLRRSADRQCRGPGANGDADPADPARRHLRPGPLRVAWRCGTAELITRRYALPAWVSVARPATLPHSARQSVLSTMPKTSSMPGAASVRLSSVPSRPTSVQARSLR